MGKEEPRKHFKRSKYFEGISEIASTQIQAKETSTLPGATTFLQK